MPKDGLIAVFSNNFVLFEKEKFVIGLKIKCFVLVKFCLT
ncbi:hypothetical protein SAMN05661044_05361 [Olivibacter domesticus]|uniref:Uncharacterized protein n=1 Tax=Olivibacter domesticus TaxID=407022 RepID=A0A1H7YWR6_OLID1|nr:hypothetical protein SAMN05661044_05361 [Olivibacter domesticus]